MTDQNTYKDLFRPFGFVMILFWMIIVLNSCLSEIDLEVPENNSESIAVVARLNFGNPSVASVRITSLANFIGFDLAEPILGATVTLLDNNGASLVLPATLENDGTGELLETGNYEMQIANEIPIEIGASYKLRIELGSEVYESTFEQLIDVPKADKISIQEVSREELNEFGNIVDRSYLQFFINTPLRVASSSDKVYLKWDFEGVYEVVETSLEVDGIPPPVDVCYITQRLNTDKIKIFNGRESRQDILLEEFILEESLDHRFSKGFYLSVFQQSISQGAFNYWNQINLITDLSGSFFEEPPGKVIGNISNVNDPNEEVFGYFSTSRTDTIRFYVNPTDYLTRTLCPFSAAPDDPNLDDSCFDCLLIPNSTLVKPDYWIE